jgi:N-acylneuraminate cytidylyltransferase
MTTFAIIPARGGSTRIPGKNIKEFHGKPIIAYSIEKAFESKLFDRVIVSTDDSAIENVAIDYGAEIYWRDPDDGVRGTQEVVKECLLGIGAREHDLVCCIYATAPLMDIEDLNVGYELVKDGSAIFAFSVGTDPLCDAGQFYWGEAEDFIYGAPLIGPLSSMIPVAPERVCDINTPEDWMRAYVMYAKLMGITE